MKEQAEKRYEITHDRHDLDKPDCDAGSGSEATSEPARPHRLAISRLVGAVADRAVTERRVPTGIVQAIRDQAAHAVLAHVAERHGWVLLCGHSRNLELVQGEGIRGRLEYACQARRAWLGS